MSNSAHAFLPFSGANEWRYCAMWPTMNQRYAETFPPDPSAAEGTAAHWVKRELWEERPVTVGTVTPNGVVVDNEMLDAAEYACGILFGGGEHSSLVTHIEQTVAARRIHSTLNWGTPDDWRITSRFLDVWEFKYGHGFVPAYENWQLINQAAAALDATGMDGHQEQDITVRMHVIQPRNYHRNGQVRSWEIPVGDLRAYFNQLTGAAEAALVPEPIATTGKHCKECPGRFACPALQRVALNAVDQSYRSLPLELSDQGAGRELLTLTAAAERLEARITGLEAQVKARVQAGAAGTGWQLEQGLAREKWKYPPEQVITMGQLNGVDLSQPDTLTPNQARKAGVAEDVVAAWSERPAGAMKLVPVDNRKAREVFKAG